MQDKIFLFFQAISPAVRLPTLIRNYFKFDIRIPWYRDSEVRVFGCHTSELFIKYHCSGNLLQNKMTHDGAGCYSAASCLPVVLTRVFSIIGKYKNMQEEGRGATSGETCGSSVRSFVQNYQYIQGVPGGMCQTLGGCSLC